MNTEKELGDKIYTIIDETDYNKDYKAILQNIGADILSDAGPEDNDLTYKDLYYLPETYSGLFIGITGKVKQVKDVITEEGQKYLLTIHVGPFRWLAEGFRGDVAGIEVGDTITVYGRLNTKDMQLDPDFGQMVCTPKLDIHTTIKFTDNIKENKTKVDWGL